VDSAGTRPALLRRNSGGSGVVPYDFRRPAKLSRDDIRALQLSFDTFARRLTTQLTTGLRQVSVISLVGIEQRSYEEHIASLETPTILAVLGIDPLPGSAILEFSVPTALAAVDYMLGGAGGDQPTRSLTEIETVILRGLIDQMLAVLRYATEPTIGLEPTLHSIEYSPQFVQAASATDTMVVALFEMRLGNQSCLATLCLPLNSLLPRLRAGQEKVPSEADKITHERHHRQLESALTGAPVEVSLRFEPARLTPGALANLAVGDVLPLNHRVNQPLTVSAGGTTFAYAMAGRQGNRLAGLIISSTESDSRG
jgi:flagellar motor switch protein FliM